MSDRFYDEQIEKLEDAADREVQARWRAACPKMSDSDLQLAWYGRVMLLGRVEARRRLADELDLHELVKAQGGAGMGNEYGEVIE